MSTTEEGVYGGGPQPNVPALECDLVMKGGVTSGVIYPSAIAEIADRFAIKSIGGTSAGAIGAAAAAAMEFGRRSGRNPGARVQMAHLAEALGEKIGGQPLLLRLFAPDSDTASLFRAAMKFSKQGSLTRILVAIFGVPLALASALCFGATVAFRVWHGPPSATDTLVLVALSAMGTVILGLVFAGAYWVPIVLRGVKAASDNGFGFCSGMASSGKVDGKVVPSLTEWLHREIQSLAGLETDAPLTFGDLWAANRRVPGVTRDDAFEAACRDAGIQAAPGGDLPLHLLPRDVELALVASDVSRAQTVQLPFMRREDRMYAYVPDLEALFPESVVNWMRSHARQSDDGTDELAGVDLGGRERDQFIRLPWPQHMPVIVGVRMSLSFPFLFRAVRMFLLRGWGGNGPAKELVELWFADGGITSNFPIHLFDSPIPTRPTFCLNLLYHDDELQPETPPRSDEANASAASGDRGLPATGRPEDLVYMLRTNGGRLATYTRFGDGPALGRMMRFAGRVITTARQWGDNQLIDVPGYRDRIVHVRMRIDEGGFNFDMGKGKIADLQARGAKAGSVIAQRFLPDADTDPLHPGEKLVLHWANHRFVRLRAFLAGVEVAVSRLDAAWQTDLARATLPRTDPGHVSPSLQQMIRAAPGATADALDQRPGYLFANKAQRDLAAQMVQDLRNVHLIVPDPSEDGVDYVKGASRGPKPKQALKLRPTADADALAERP